MKFVKLIRPLFLVALGLHGLALFLPIGEAAKTADVKLSEDAVLTKRSSPSPKKLPAPDLNVATEKTASSGAFSSVLSPTIARQAAPITMATRSGSATRSAPLAAAVPDAVATHVMPTGSSPNSPNGPNAPASSFPPVSPASTSDAAAADSAIRDSAIRDSAIRDSAIASSPSSIPTQTSANENSTGPQASNPLEQSAEEIAEPNRNLIASSTRQLPDSLKALMNRWAIALTYNPKGTDDSSAKTAQSKWMDKINAQASGIGVGSLDSKILEPKLVKAFAQVSYPIESSVRDDEDSPPENRKQSFRVCLDQPPSFAEVGVLFDSQGEIAGEPHLIRSTGYLAINEEAVATVEAAKNFPEDRLSKAFIFEVKVDYDPKSCVKLLDLKS